MKKPLRLVTWLDSSTLNRGGWMRSDEIDPMPLCTIRSVGWVTRLDKRMLILSGCESDGGLTGRLTAIPRRCILKMEKIECIQKKLRPKSKTL